MERYFVLLFLLLKLRVLTLMVVRISIIHLISLLIENLYLHEVDPLLYKIYISKVLQMHHEFDYCA